ncbi:adhesin for cattle intestine colonization [Escherichia coli]|uniref:Adhesin for cattle intestine colonization n=1 Tax=Escherichia coli TaxID=562 RepID=A0A376LJC9_ECOLX|nr:adhesin for cattle intestine colonization [Escherichia coli]
MVDTINPTATPTIVSYTDDVGQRQGTLSSSQATDDTTPLLNGVLSGPLASGEVVYLYRNGLLLGAVTMVGALNWNLQRQRAGPAVPIPTVREWWIWRGTSPPPVILS